MSLRRRVRTVLACVVLECGALVGVPMRFEELEELLRSLNEPKVAQAGPQEREADGNGPVPPGV